MLLNKNVYGDFYVKAAEIDYHKVNSITLILFNLRQTISRDPSRDYSNCDSRISLWQILYIINISFFMEFKLRFILEANKIVFD